MDYILGEKPEDCVLCRYQNLGLDKENLILLRAKHSYIMMNRYPYNNGHLMIMPYSHVCSLAGLDHETWLEMALLVLEAEMVLQRVYQCDGINIGMNLGCAAGAGIAEHLHIHLVPRWAGDSNFMSVVSGERVIPESFESSYARLFPEFAKLMENKE
jgi:ATP adenylyltransferase